MTLLGRFRAALGRDDASLLARAERDLALGLGLNPPACLPPLNRAIAALERLTQSPPVALMLGRALRAKAQAVGGQAARDLRARAVAKLTAQLSRSGLTAATRAALSQGLAQAWLPLPDEAADLPLTYRQLTRALEAQTDALVQPDASAHLAMADIALLMCRHPLCPDPLAMARLALQHESRARHFPVTRDQQEAGDSLQAAVSALFPGLSEHPAR